MKRNQNQGQSQKQSRARRNEKRARTSPSEIVRDARRAMLVGVGATKWDDFTHGAKEFSTDLEYTELSMGTRKMRVPRPKNDGLWIPSIDNEGNPIPRSKER